MANSNTQGGQGAESNKKATPVPTDDSPRREDELLGDLLQDPSPEDDGKLSGQDEKGVIPGKKTPD